MASHHAEQRDLALYIFLEDMLVNLSCTESTGAYGCLWMHAC